MKNYFKTDLYGFSKPDPCFLNVSFKAFLTGDHFYLNYKAGIKRSLEKFISCFYYDDNGFKENKLDEFAWLIVDKISIEKQIAISDDYTLIRSELEKLFPFFFNRLFINPPNPVMSFVEILESMGSGAITYPLSSKPGFLFFNLNVFNSFAKTYIEMGPDEAIKKTYEIKQLSPTILELGNNLN